MPGYARCRSAVHEPARPPEGRIDRGALHGGCLMNELEIKQGHAAGGSARRADMGDPARAAAAASVPPVKAAPPPWSGRQARAMDGETLLRCMVGACLAQIRPNADAIAHGSRDPE